jgi:hypothetical protein
MDADVDKRLAVHEAICLERYNNIDKSLRDGDKRMTKIEYLGRGNHCCGLHNCLCHLG